MIPKSFIGIIGLILVLALFVGSYTGQEIAPQNTIDVNEINTGDLGILGTAGLLAQIVPNIIGTLVNALGSLLIIFTMLPVTFQLLCTFIILCGIVAFVKIVWSGE